MKPAVVGEHFFRILKPQTFVVKTYGDMEEAYLWPQFKPLLHVRSFDGAYIIFYHFTNWRLKRREEEVMYIIKPRLNHFWWGMHY